MKYSICILGLIFVAVLVSITPAVVGQDNLDTLEQQAFKKAAEQVAPSVVRIETLGRIGDSALTRMTGGPTSGLVVDPKGLIVTSAAPFFSKPGTILVQTPDGGRYAGKLVAVDYLRMLALIQVDAQKPLPMPKLAEQDKVRVGAWAIAVGRAFDPRKTNMTVGIVSGLGRVGGKAIQTDAATSPNNYGGPLVDIRGDVLGLVVPLSQKPSEKVDVGWYDSGIGFAIPADVIINDVVPRLKKGKDLKPGAIGVGFRPSDPNTTEAIVASIEKNSPAAKAKIAVGDRIVAINSKPVARVVELQDLLGTHYAGDEVTVAFERKGKREEAKLTLIERKIPKPKKKPHGHRPPRKK